jgi:hypothetical protein
VACVIGTTSPTSSAIAAIVAVSETRIPKRERFSSICAICPAR